MSVEPPSGEHPVLQLLSQWWIPLLAGVEELVAGRITSGLTWSGIAVAALLVHHYVQRGVALPKATRPSAIVGVMLLATALVIGGFFRSKRTPVAHEQASASSSSTVAAPSIAPPASTPPP